jgi:adenosylhomocysteine nucleosidase
MELYGIAYVCQKNGIPWRAVKYITDKVGLNSGNEWQKQLKLAPSALNDYLLRII